MRGEVAFVTKILVPRRRRDAIRRARLLTALRQGEGGRLAVVRAPAGYGKTTLLLDLAHEAGANVCWVSLDEWDRDAATFLQYLRLSVLRGISSTGARSGPSLPVRDPRIVLGNLTTKIASLSEEIRIFLDDFHCLEGSEELLGLVDYFVQRLPPNCRLFLASRTPPGLPSLARLRLEGRALELGPSDLAFTADEIKLYYRTTLQQEISDSQAQRVAGFTEGWPAAVVLLGDSPLAWTEGSDAPASMSEYLAAEILDRLPEPMARLLLWTSVFDALEEGACEAVLHEKGVVALLESLEKHNVPLTRLEGAVREYRVHPLFRDFLRRKLRLENLELYRRLNLDAAAWQMDLGRPNEAIWHFAQAGEWDRATEVIQDEAPKAYKIGRWQTITSWLEMIPPDQRQRRRQLRLWQARVLARLGQADEALRIVSEAVDGLAVAGDAPLLAEFETVRATALRLKGDSVWARASSQRSVDLAVKGNAPIDVLAEARKQLGLVLAAQGLFSEAAAEFRNVLDVYEQRGDSEEIAFVSGCLGSALGSAGRLVDSIPYLDQARQQWRKVGNDKELSWVVNNLAMIYYLMGQVDLARELFAEALSKARAAGNPRSEAYPLLSLADIDRQAGDYAKAIERYEEALRIADDLGQASISVLALIGISHTHRLTGELGKAEMLARQALASAEERQSAYEQGLAHMALGRLARRQGKPAGAISSLSAAVTLFQGVSAHRELAEALYFLADAYLPAKRSRTLLAGTLERLVHVVWNLGHDQFLMPAVREAPAAAQLGASKKIGDTFYRDLLRRTVDMGAAASGSIPRDMRHSGFPVVEMVALGDVEVRMDGRKIMDVEWESEKSKELLLVLLTVGRPLRRDEIVARLWPDAGGSRAVSSFHSGLYRVRRALYPECIIESGGAYALNPDGAFHYDVREFERLANSARRLSEDDSDYFDALTAAVELYRGPFAPAVEPEWAEYHRFRLAEQFLELASKLAERFLRQGDFARAALACQRVLEHDPYNEAACYKLVKAYSSSGDDEAALAGYRHFRRTLEADLGEQPGEALRRLYSEIRGHLGQAVP